MKDQTSVDDFKAAMGKLLELSKEVKNPERFILKQAMGNLWHSLNRMSVLGDHKQRDTLEEAYQAVKVAHETIDDDLARLQ